MNTNEKTAKRLASALSDLLDEQNGPPLVKRQRGWEEAVHEAREALSEFYGETDIERRLHEANNLAELYRSITNYIFHHGNEDWFPEKEFFGQWLVDIYDLMVERGYWITREPPKLTASLEKFRRDA